jgi:hypothetical protein
MKPVIMLVTLGNILAKRFELGVSGDQVKPDYPTNYLKALNLSSDQLEQVESAMPTEMERAQGFLSAARS